MKVIQYYAISSTHEEKVNEYIYAELTTILWEAKCRFSYGRLQCQSRISNCWKIRFTTSQRENQQVELNKTKNMINLDPSDVMRIDDNEVH